jgi:hypothetical protein
MRSMTTPATRPRSRVKISKRRFTCGVSGISFSLIAKTFVKTAKTIDW